MLIGAGVWLPMLRLFYVDDASHYFDWTAAPTRVRELAARHLALWETEAGRAEQIERMRHSNAEWDFMGRTFLVMAMANMALREPDREAEYLAVMDEIITDTLDVERTMGMDRFLMGYSRRGTFVQQPRRSVFVDGEIVLMLGARRMVSEDASMAALFGERVGIMAERMERAPHRWTESYPNECWMFCNAAAMAGLRMSEVLDGRDHSALRDSWLAEVRRKLVHAETGLLISSFTLDGEPLDGPEGSSIWFVAHCLQVVDAALAADQYARAKAELGGSFLGFGYAREWPESWRGPTDVDSGAVIPGLDISAGASGMAFIAAAAFEDEAYLAGLLASVDFAGFGETTDGRRMYCASNQVGDAVLLYALVQGPLWERLGRGR